jgi:GGDEF domain-containing protein
MAPDAPHRRSARPVADAPIDGLLARSDEVAKGWALTLIAQAPLHQASSILTEPLTRDGPRVCDAALRALADETDLRRLQVGGALRPLVARVGEMTGATSAAEASRSVDALHDVLWSALREELRAPGPDLVSDLAQRLAYVCALIREAALGHGGPGGERELAPVSAERTEAVAPPTPPPRPAAPESPWRPPAAEQRLTGPPAPVSTEPPVPAPASVSTDPPVPAPASVSTDPPASAAASAATEPPAGGAPPADSVKPSVAAPPLWLSALADEVRRAVSDGAALSLLLAELEDADRLALSAPDRAATAIGEFTAAVRRVLRGQDILVHESGARAWVIARGTQRPGAHSLAARIAEAVGETLVLAGAPLAASVGIAVLGEDGQLSEELIDAAEEARFAASARGIEVSRRVR